MADISRAMQTPPPGTPTQSTVAHTPPAPQPAPIDTSITTSRDAKNERDRQRRKAKRAADAKAAAAKAAKPKKKKAAKKAATVAIGRKRSRPAKRKKTAELVDAALKKAGVRGLPKKRGRGRPPGAKNKPKVGAVAEVAAKVRSAVASQPAVLTALMTIPPGDVLAFRNAANEVMAMSPAGRTVALAALATMFK